MKLGDTLRKEGTPLQNDGLQQDFVFHLAHHTAAATCRADPFPT